MTRNKSKTNNGAGKSTYKCTYCDQPGHTEKHCYEIVGYPNWWDHNQAPRRRNTKKNQPPVAADEANTKNDTIETTSTIIATLGNNGKSFYIFTPVGNNTWIID